MFNTEEKINRILNLESNKKERNNMNFKNSFSFDKNNKLSLQGQYDPNYLVNEIKRLFNKLPDVKEAKGSLFVKFKNGKKQKINLVYFE